MSRRCPERHHQNDQHAVVDLIDNPVVARAYLPLIVAADKLSRTGRPGVCTKELNWCY
jgi:hypothetical protein